MASSTSSADGTDHFGLSEAAACPSVSANQPTPILPRRVKKSILVLEFSQTGQLTAVLDRLLGPLFEAPDEFMVHRERLQTEPAAPFPWPFWRFLDTFPETVADLPPPLRPLGIEASANFDLVVLGYPIWFLSPPPALTAFFQSPAAARLLRDRPVVTVTACRNMWVAAQQRVQQHLLRLGARHRDHVALVDQGSACASFVTTPRWMLTGRKNAFGPFPAAGVSERDIRAGRRFGLALRQALRRDEETLDRPMLHGLGACTVNAGLVSSERVGLRSFRLWSAVLRASGPPGAPLRRVILAAYLIFLVVLILTIVPLSLLAKAALRPFLRKSIQALQENLALPSGSDTSRLSQFDE